MSRLSEPRSTLEYMGEFTRIDDAHSARALADRLNGQDRTRPLVVVTIPARREDPWIDVAEIAREAGDLAEVYLMPTGRFSWTFSHEMVEGTQVYGGAARVYPVGHEWASDLTKSPLRFAFSAADGRRATQQIISDMLRAAVGTGLLRSKPIQELRQVQGLVSMSVAGRALVDIGNAFPATIAEELTAEDLPIERLVSVGQSVQGWLDPQSNRLDVTKSLRAPADALAAYSVGDVVLAQVSVVAENEARLILYPPTNEPAVGVSISRADVTLNPLDDLRTLLTVGEAVRARVVEAGPAWSLRLNDVDDDEPIVAAPPLLQGGPPWLVEEDPELLAVEEQPRSAAAVLQAPPTDPEPATDEAPNDDDAPPPPRPSPLMLDHKRAQTGPTPPPVRVPAVARSESTKQRLQKIDQLGSEIKSLKRERDALRAQLNASADENRQILMLRDEAERRANRAEHDLKVTRSRLRKAGNAKTVQARSEVPHFADPEQGFRYLVLTRWAIRTLPNEQQDRPLGDYVIGPDFLASLQDLEGVSKEKVADVVFEIVTGLAKQIPGREVHRYRTGAGGDNPALLRADGAVCWRASLQRHTPSARRIHYWVLPDQTIELGCVTTHDGDLA